MSQAMSTKPRQDNVFGQTTGTSGKTKQEVNWKDQQNSRKVKGRQICIMPGFHHSIESSALFQF